MSIHRAAAKRDKNEPEIIAALLAVGASVSQLSGKGLPDLLVGFQGTNYLLEVKNKEAGGKLKPDQVAFIEGWQGRPVVVVWSVADALKAIGATFQLGQEFKRRAMLASCAELLALHSLLFASFALPTPSDLGAVKSRSTYHKFGLVVTGHAQGWQIKIGEYVISQGTDEKIAGQEAALLVILEAALPDHMLDEDKQKARRKAYKQAEPVTPEAIAGALAAKPKALPKPSKIKDSGYRGPNVMARLLAKE
jgi:hypothetical protein